MMTSFEFPRIIDRIQVGKGPTGIHPQMPLIQALSQFMMILETLAIKGRSK